MVAGINHITLSVQDLEASFTFYTAVLGLKPVARWYKGAYLQAGESWVCLTLDPNTRTAAHPEYTHTAFTVSTTDFSQLVERIQTAQAVCWQENLSPGDSFYFLDPNGHKLEIHVSNLSDRLQTLKKHSPKDLVLFENLQDDLRAI
jgi:catechol 2,3-dioxygenase-like lactoylglutathione lyase family enzyme